MNSNKNYSNNRNHFTYTTKGNNKINSENINKSGINKIIRKNNIKSKNLANSSNYNTNEQSSDKSYQENFNSMLQSIGNKASMTKYLIKNRAKSKSSQSVSNKDAKKLVYNHTLTDNDDNTNNNYYNYYNKNTSDEYNTSNNYVNKESNSIDEILSNDNSSSNDNVDKYVKTTHTNSFDIEKLLELVKKHKPVIIAVAFILFIVLVVSTTIITRNHNKDTKISAKNANKNISVLDALSNNGLSKDTIDDNLDFSEFINGTDESASNDDSNNALLNPNNPLINTNNPLFAKDTKNLTQDERIERLNRLRRTTSAIPYANDQASDKSSNVLDVASNKNDTSKNESNSNQNNNTNKDSKTANNKSSSNSKTSNSNTPSSNNNTKNNTSYTPTYSQSILYNSSSSIGDGRYGWTIGGYNGGSVTSYGGPDSYNITVKQIGTLPWHVQMFQQGLQFKQGKKYRVSFNIHSSIARHIAVLVQETHGQWHAHTEKIYSIPANQTSTICFVTSAITGDPDKFYIGLGKVNGDSYLPQHNITISHVSICAQN